MTDFGFIFKKKKNGTSRESLKKGIQVNKHFIFYLESLKVVIFRIQENNYLRKMYRIKNVYKAKIIYTKSGAQK